MGNFQGGARSANFEGSGGIFSNMAPNKSIFRAFLGGRRVCQGGRQTILGCQGGGRPPLFCNTGPSLTIIYYWAKFHGGGRSDVVKRDRPGFPKRGPTLDPKTDTVSHPSSFCPNLPIYILQQLWRGEMRKYDVAPFCGVFTAGLSQGFLS